MIEPMDDGQGVVVWGEDGAPRSRRFGDIYFSSDDGLAESRAVFLQGCGLPEAWQGRTHFTIGELGFGSGLNIAALLDLWAEAAPADAHLHIFSVEAFPLSRADADRALGAWPQIAAAANVLLENWPTSASGFQRIDIPGYRATLDLAVMEVAPALRAWGGTADAWFLDGFSPASNPQMWSDEVLALVAARSAPGARIATFTVAGQVRRGLQAQGLTVDKRPGHGRKRERLEATAPGVREPAATPARVAIVGAGIAGAALARALRSQGVQPVVIDTVGAGAGASGNPAALVTPGLDASGGPMARFYAQAHARAVRLYRQTANEAIIAQGVLRLAPDARDESRFERVARQDIFPPASVRMLDAEAACALTGEPSPPGLMLGDSLVVDPRMVLKAWIGADLVIGDLAGFEPEGDGWRLAFADGRPAMHADAVIVAAGWGSARLAPHLGLSPVRGQASILATPERPYPTVYGDYLIPTRDGLLFGATHDRGDDEADPRPSDDGRNLARLAALRPHVASKVALADVQGRAAIRAATPDRLPVAGLLAEPGLFVLSGLGSRGFTTAPLLAEQLCALILGTPPPLPADLAHRLSPARFKREPA
jgi:tRNA 5-methylaminomethyl-2-thiouridine biosynthesis bifunctional protein